MNEYKFRGKEVDTGKWIYGGLFKEPAPPQCFEKTLEDKYWIVYSDPRYMPDWNLPYKMVRTDVEKETIGQYTGLKDHNMKEIYEGDIIICKQYIGGNYVEYYIEKGFVEFRNGEFGLHRKEGYYQSLNKFLEYDYELEVIGNIYDNPELLEKGE